MTLHTLYVLTLIRLPWLTVPSSSSSGRRRRSRDSRFTASTTSNNSANSNPPSAPFSPNKHARHTRLPRRSSCRMQFPHSLTLPSPQAAIDVVGQLEAATRQLRGLHRCKVTDKTNRQPVVKSSISFARWWSSLCLCCFRPLPWCSASRSRSPPHLASPHLARSSPLALTTEAVTACSRRQSSRNSSSVALTWRVRPPRLCRCWRRCFCCHCS